VKRRCHWIFECAAGLALTTVLGSAAHAATKPSIRCTPTVVHEEDTLTLVMSIPHPAELAVSDPEGTPFFLVYDPDPGRSRSRPLYSKEQFRPMRVVRLNVADATGTPWVADRSNERLFTKLGTYRFQMTEVLETEGLPVYQCTVEHRSRKP
jgi:hypothetical protein